MPRARPVLGLSLALALAGCIGRSALDDAPAGGTGATDGEPTERTTAPPVRSVPPRDEPEDVPPARPPPDRPPPQDGPPPPEDPMLPGEDGGIDPDQDGGR